MMQLLAALVTITGIAVHGDLALPGITVTLSDGAINRTVVTGPDGRYTFADVAEGTYELRYELSGLPPVERRFTATAGAAELEPQEMVFPIVDAMTIACGPPCSEEPPASPYDLPLCTDLELHDRWIEAAKNGDRSANALLRRRYEETLSLSERHRIGVTLDDPRIWRELLAKAELCVRFPRDEENTLPAQWLEWCAARGLPPEEHWDSSFGAFIAVSDDRRARDLMRRALDSQSVWIASMAVDGLARQRDLASLPAIERVLPRLAEDAGNFTILALAFFQSPDADALAMRFLDEDEREQYQELRNQP